MPLCHSTNDVRDPRRAMIRAPRQRVRSWTGRAAMSSMTDTLVPRFVTAGTHRTRVSEMRLPAGTDSRSMFERMSVPGSATQQGRRDAGVHHAGAENP